MDRQLVTVPFRDGAARLHRRVELAGRPVPSPDDDVGFGETLLGVSSRTDRRRRAGDVAALVAHGWRIGCQRALSRRSERTHLIVDVNGASGGPRLTQRRRTNAGDRLSGVADLRIEEPHAPGPNRLATF